jgi:hypothetical protein
MTYADISLTEVLREREVDDEGGKSRLGLLKCLYGAIDTTQIKFTLQKVLNYSPLSLAIYLQWG